MIQRYNTFAIVLHWIVALLVVCGFTLGLTMVDIAGLTPTKLRYFSWHKWIGMTILGLACIRLLWRLFHPAPPYAPGMPRWQRLSAGIVHAGLYALIFLVPISGYLYSLAAGVPVVYLGLFPLPVVIDPNPEWKLVLKQVHYWLNMALLAGVAIHVAAALKHQLIDRDGTIERMVPGKK